MINPKTIGSAIYQSSSSSQHEIDVSLLDQSSFARSNRMGFLHPLMPLYYLCRFCRAIRSRYNKKEE